LSASALANTVQSAVATLNIEFGVPFVPNQDSSIELKLISGHYGIIDLLDFTSNAHPDTSYDFYFFERVNFLQAGKIINDSSTSIDLGALEKTN
jgi:hypothetical protein